MSIVHIIVYFDDSYRNVTAVIGNSLIIGADIAKIKALLNGTLAFAKTPYMTALYLHVDAINGLFQWLNILGKHNILVFKRCKRKLHDLFYRRSKNIMIWTAIALIFVILFRKHLIRLNNTFFIFDTIGLALFTVVGIEKTLDCHYPFWVAIIMGTITGAAGGIIRDIFINQIPLIFRKEIYAIACIIGGIVYYATDMIFNDNTIVQVLCALSVALTRIIAVKYQIGLPHIKGEEETE